jgi:hypothetical protein
MAKVWLPIDVLSVIAKTNMEAYYQLLAIARFARTVIGNNIANRRWQEYFTTYEITHDKDGSVYHKWYLTHKSHEKILHRHDDPAFVVYRPDASTGKLVVSEQQWRLNDMMCRSDGGPTVITANGAQWWHMHKVRDELYIHREGAPALIMQDGTQFWYRFSNLHRSDGPAIVCPSGRCHYYLNGKLATREEVMGSQLEI